jgi:rare lipoprotein A
MRRYYGVARTVLASCLIILFFVTLGHSTARAQQDADGAEFKGQQGLASFYGKAHQGKRTASGALFDSKDMTAAHPSLPFGTKILVTVQGTGRAVLVTITDRLPSRRRIIDLSRAAAAKLGIIRQGVAMVTLSPG